MTYSVPLYSTLNMEGVDLSTAFTLSTSTPEYPAQPFIQGATVLGTLDGKWVYATAAAVQATGDVCILTKTFQAIGLLSSNAAAHYGEPLGVAMTATTTGQFAWYQTNGASPGISVLASTAPNVILYTTATAGRLGSALTTGASSTIQGIVTTTTSASTAGTYPGILNTPQIFTAN